MEARKPKRSLHFYFLSLGMLLRSRMSYRIDFFIMLVAVFIKEFANIALLLVIVSRFENLAGWTSWQIGFLYCMVSFCSRMYYSLFGNVSSIPDLVVMGSLDIYLLSPRNPLIMIISRAFIWRIFYNVGIFGVLVYLYIKAGIPLTPLNILMFFISIASSIAIIFALNLIFGSLSFYITNTKSIISIINQLQSKYLKYPLSIFGGIFGFIFTFILPLGFIAYYPSAYLLGIDSGILFGPNMGLYTPLVATILVLISLGIWKMGLKKYNSTGT